MSIGFDPIKRLSNVSMTDGGVMQDLANWIIDNRDRIADLPLSDVAELANVSETTVFRLSQKIGFSGYREMRMALAEIRGVARGRALHQNDVEAKDDSPYGSIARNTIYVHTSILQTTLELLDAAVLEMAVTAMQGASVIHLIGFGSSAAPALDIYQRLLRFGFATNIHSDPHILSSVTANPAPGSLFFAISFSGQSRDVVDALISVERHGMKSILITSNPDAAAWAHADITLLSAPSGVLIGSENEDGSSASCRSCPNHGHGHGRGQYGDLQVVEPCHSDFAEDG